MARTQKRSAPGTATAATGTKRKTAPDTAAANEAGAGAPRALWKGAVSFGLIHIPVQLHPAEKTERLDLDMLDKRDYAPVGYKRVNKETGEEVPWDEIVKGYEYEEGRYVVLTDEELREANPEAARSIQLLAFVPAAQIPVEYFEQPYVLAPGAGGDGVYALLRETLKRSGRVGIAQVAIRTRQTLAALLPEGRRLVLMTLRYPQELRLLDDAALPPADLAELGLSDREVDMAVTLVEQMSEDWRPEQYRDRFIDDVMALIQRKIGRHDTHGVLPAREAAPIPEPPKNVVDLVALLKQSLAAGRGGETQEAANEPEHGGPAEDGMAGAASHAAAREGAHHAMTSERRRHK